MQGWGAGRGTQGAEEGVPGLRRSSREGQRWSAQNPGREQRGGVSLPPPASCPGPGVHATRGPRSLRQPGPCCLEQLLGFLSTAALTAAGGQSPFPPVPVASSWLQTGSRRWSACPVTGVELPLPISCSSWWPWSSLGCPGHPQAVWELHVRLRQQQDARAGAGLHGG